ncbi:MAG: hypothetical protein JWR37_5083 [Mycobacterium sp.]|nr:hypothetical protein [Mycobacterium sp.]
MTKFATKVRVGIAGCAIAVAASLTSVAPAEAAPVVPAPATPAVLGPADVPMGFGWWWGSDGVSRSPDILRTFRPSTGWKFNKIFHFGCYNRHA